MEPQLPQVNVQPEGQPVPPNAPEQAIDVQETNPEAPIQSPEAAKNTEKSKTDNLGQVTPATTDTTQAVDDTPQQEQTNVDDANPTTAGDSDVIEKEWITKAKAIVSETSNNPHDQQDKVSKLMADYVLKRYGRRIGEDNG